MADSGDSAEDALILEPLDAQRLGQACPGLHRWPQSWHVEPADIAIGKAIVRAFAPFLLHLLDQGLARATVRRHSNNLWLLGGEIIRRRYEDDELAGQDVRQAIRQLIDRDGGPTIWPRVSETEQDSLDSTCRKLDRFMRESAAVDSSA